MHVLKAVDQSYFSLDIDILAGVGHYVGHVFFLASVGMQPLYPTIAKILQ